MWDAMKKHPVLVGGVTVVAVLVLAAIVFATIGGDDDGDGDGGGNGAESTGTQRGFIKATDLKVGDCVRNAKGETGEGDRFKAVNCERRHGGEVYTVIKLAGERYPGAKRVTAKAERGCRARLRRDYPATFNDATVGFTYVYPTKGTWDDGFRQVTCLAAFEKKRRGPLTI